MKKMFNKTLSILLTLVFIVTICGFGNVNTYAISAKKGKLSAQVATTIYVGKTKVITTKFNKKRVKKGVKYKSGNKKIATVNKSGKVKAIKNGTVKIKVTYKKKSVTLKVTVKSKKVALPMAKGNSAKTFKSGKYKITFDAGKGIVVGNFKTYKGYLSEFPVAYKRGYKFLGWYSGKTRYDYGTKINKSVSLKPKYSELKMSDYTDMVNIDYLTNIYKNAFYDELQDVVIDSGKPWKNNIAVKKYYVKHLISRGYCPNTYFNPSAYIKIVKSKYGIELSSYKEAFDFYLGCGENNDDYSTLKCIHEGGKYDDSFIDIEYDYYQNKYKVYEPGGDNYSMLCGECGKYFYGPTKHDDWALHMFYICDELGLPGSGWAPYDDQYDIFYKKEDHEHTDTVRRTYCQNKGKKVKQKILKSDYTPYRTDVPMSYPPTGPVLWYVDKF